MARLKSMLHEGRKCVYIAQWHDVRVCCIMARVKGMLHEGKTCVYVACRQDVRVNCVKSRPTSYKLPVSFYSGLWRFFKTSWKAVRKLVALKGKAV